MTVMLSNETLMFPHKITDDILHNIVFNNQSSYKNCPVSIGKLIADIIKSEIARLIMNFVVKFFCIFELFRNAIIVIIFPVNK